MRFHSNGEQVSRKRFRVCFPTIIRFRQKREGVSRFRPKIQSHSTQKLLEGTLQGFAKFGSTRNEEKFYRRISRFEVRASYEKKSM